MSAFLSLGLLSAASAEDALFDLFEYGNYHDSVVCEVPETLSVKIFAFNPETFPQANEKGEFEGVQTLLKKKPVQVSVENPQENIKGNTLISSISGCEMKFSVELKNKEKVQVDTESDQLVINGKSFEGVDCYVMHCM